MGLLQIHSPIAVFLSKPVSSSHSKPPRLPPFQDPTRNFGQSSLFSSSPGVKDRVFTLSTAPRKLLCTPPQGKHVREDYLVKKLSAQEVQELVRGERNVPLIIDFYATWCGPCILMAQELEMLAVEYENNAMIVKVDTDDEYEFARDMQVRGLPTLYFISPDPNKDAIRTEGLIPIQMMRDILDNEM
ncbi:hypothetical protein ACJRO7_029253 [Eucalyptus globulus]|uniref:Thioredoxin domain-containing protein n=1 Tax=Eucalyptus globulus TaxID=34317 RepID=A0ABD3JXE8_EUCGL